jgi:hypothetical protein
MNFPLNIFEGAPILFCFLQTTTLNSFNFETLGTLETKIIFRWYVFIGYVSSILGKNYRWIKCYVNGNYIMQNTLGT